MEAIDTMEDMADGTREGGLPRGGDDRCDRDSDPKLPGKARPDECGGIGLTGDDDLILGGDAELVPFDEDCLYSLEGLLLLAEVVLLPVSIVAEVLDGDAPLDRHIALSNEPEHASTGTTGGTCCLAILPNDQSVLFLSSVSFKIT